MQLQRVYRSKLNDARTKLAHSTAQLRAIERRLLARFKDKTPTPLTNLDTLMEGTYRHVLEATDEVEAATEAVSASGNNLACITSTLVFLMRLTGPAAGMSADDVSMVQSALSPIVHDSQDQVRAYNSMNLMLEGNF